MEALEVAVKLVATAGFNPVVAGDLTISRTLESVQALLISLTMKQPHPPWRYQTRYPRSGIQGNR